MMYIQFINNNRDFTQLSGFTFSSSLRQESSLSEAKFIRSRLKLIFILGQEFRN